MAASAIPPGEWRFVGACGDGERFILQGVNVWDHNWIPIERTPPPTPTGDDLANLIARREHVVVKDPTYGQDHEFDVYQIVTNPQRIVFAAGEFSSSIWGFYTKGGIR
jgi:hypothetical protein